MLSSCSPAQALAFGSAPLQYIWSCRLHAGPRSKPDYPAFLAARGLVGEEGDVLTIRCNTVGGGIKSYRDRLWEIIELVTFRLGPGESFPLQAKSQYNQAGEGEGRAPGTGVWLGAHGEWWGARGTPHQERQVTERRKHTQFRKFVFSHIKPFG